MVLIDKSRCVHLHPYRETEKILALWELLGVPKGLHPGNQYPEKYLSSTDTDHTNSGVW